MSRTRSILLLGLALALAAACERPSERQEQERQKVGRALRGTLSYPGSVVLDYGAGDEAAELVLGTSATPGAVVEWYRKALAAERWELRSESRERDGTVTLYAEREGRPLWVRLWPAAGGGTAYALVGVALRGDSVR